MKLCTKCKKDKPFSEFHARKDSRSGYASHCKVCRKEVWDKNKEERAIKSKLYRDNNKDKLSAKRREYYLKNKDRENAYMKQYAIDNADKIRAANKAYRENNKARKKELDKKYREENKEKIAEYKREWIKTEIGKASKRASNHKRDLRTKETNDGTITRRSLVELFIEQDNKCFHCERELDHHAKGAVHLDHLIPLSKGGCHTISNVRWSCASCNLTKQAKLIY